MTALTRTELPRRWPGPVHSRHSSRPGHGFLCAGALECEGELETATQTRPAARLRWLRTRAVRAEHRSC